MQASIVMPHKACRLLPMVLVVACSCVTRAPGALKSFDGAITRPQLEYFLSRAMTMEALLVDHGELPAEIRLLQTTGARLAGRTLYLWGGEQNFPAALAAAKARELKIHAALPNLMLQAAIFEIVSQGVESLEVPAWVFAEFKLPVSVRKFSYEAMLYPGKTLRNNWGKNSSVPDITQQETQMFFFYLAAEYINLGIEAIHFGQVELMGRRDTDRTVWESLLGRVREYAKLHARRKIVVCDAHVPRGGFSVGERLLFDFHSFPLRIDEVPDKPLAGVLKVGYLDSLYGRSRGGITPSGWRCEHLPYLVEFDNFGRSRREGQNIGKHWIWGYDEITWFAHLSHDERDAFLRYAAKWIRENDPNGYLQMPGSRTIAVKVDGKDWYWANTPGEDCPTGFGDEDTIRAIWSDTSAAPQARSKSQ